MFDVAWSEMAVIAVVTLIAVGPKDLPKVVYEAGKWVRRARSLSREFQGAFDQMMREAELNEIRTKAEDAARAASSGKLLSDVLDPDHVLAAAFNPTLFGAEQTQSTQATAMADASYGVPQPALVPPGETPPETSAEGDHAAEELEDLENLTLAPVPPTAADDHDDFDDLPLNVVVPPVVVTTAEAKPVPESGPEPEITKTISVGSAGHE
ncbi:sec-independent protein translocase protein TatB [uncultured Gammaproteobacteria bacterium]